MEEWKRFYSNNEAEAFNKYLWEKFDNTGFSWWKATYKYNEDNKVSFMTENLIGGMYQVSRPLVLRNSRNLNKIPKSNVLPWCDTRKILPLWDFQIYLTYYLSSCSDLTVVVNTYSELLSWSKTRSMTRTASLSKVRLFSRNFYSDLVGRGQAYGFSLCNSLKESKLNFVHIEKESWSPLRNWHC